MKRIILILLVVLAFGNTVKANRDSLGVKKVNNKWFILHKVDKGTGVYTIAKHYGVTEQEVLASNPGLEKGILPGQVLLIPYNGKIPEEKQVTSSEDNGRVPHYYTVEQGITLYRISVMYKVNVDQIKKWNGLTSNDITVGQRLIVGYTVGAGDETSPAPSFTAKEKRASAPVQKVTSSAKNNSKIEIREIQEAVLATAIDDGDLSDATNLALHRTAPAGTIIKITNPMNNESVFVKVVGPLAADDSQPKLMMKISRSTAEKLGIKDEYFRLNTHYSAEITKK